MIRFLVALLLAGYVLSVPIDPEIKDLEVTQAPGDTDEVSTEKPSLPKQESDLETEPSVWFSYHHSIHGVPPPPLIIPRPRVYTSYYADYAPYPYWSTW